MMTSRNPRLIGRRQEGVATLLIALILMVAVTITVIFTAQTAVLEQRMSGNEVRMKQAGSAAQAGIERGTYYLQNGYSIATGDDVVPTMLAPDDDDGSTYRALFLPPEASGWDIDCPATPPADASGFTFPVALGDAVPPDTLDMVILSCAWSDDRSARRGVTTALRAGPSVANAPTNPLIARGGVNTNGRARVFNGYNTLTIWSGSDLAVTGNPGNTFVRDVGVDAPSDTDTWPLQDLPSSCEKDSTNYVCRTGQQAGVGPDVIDGDLTLANMDGDTFFQGFMGYTQEEYRETQVSGLGEHEDPIAMLEAGDANNKVVWVDGEEHANADGWVELDADSIGTRDEPTVLIVDGNLDVTGNLDFTGILYVTGDLRTGGNPTFQGASVVQGETVGAAGTPYFIFDPVAAQGASEIGARGTVSGSWRDWTSTDN